MRPDCVLSVDAGCLAPVSRRDQVAEWMIDNVPALMTYVDRDLRVVFANATFERWLGFKPSNMVGQHLSECIGQVMFAERYEFLLQALAGKPTTFDMRVPIEGSMRNLQASYVPDMSSGHMVSGIFILVFDVSIIKLSERQAHKLARTDNLTQLPNRLQFNECAQKAFEKSRTSERNTALLFLDIDRFKSINDTYGHIAGDTVLIEVSRRLRSCVQEPSTLARFAGDEFVILLEISGDMKKAIDFAEIICGLLEAPISVGSDLLCITVSVGITSIETDDAMVDAALIRADKALYKAKSIKGNTYMVSDVDDMSSMNLAMS